MNGDDYHAAALLLDPFAVGCDWITPAGLTEPCLLRVDWISGGWRDFRTLAEVRAFVADQDRKAYLVSRPCWRCLRCGHVWICRDRDHLPKRCASRSCKQKGWATPAVRRRRGSTPAAV